MIGGFPCSSLLDPILRVDNISLHAHAACTVVVGYIASPTLQTKQGQDYIMMIMTSDLEA